MASDVGMVGDRVSGPHDAGSGDVGVTVTLTIMISASVLTQPEYVTCHELPDMHMSSMIWRSLTSLWIARENWWCICGQDCNGILASNNDCST